MRCQNDLETCSCTHFLGDDTSMPLNSSAFLVIGDKWIKIIRVGRARDGCKQIKVVTAEQSLIRLPGVWL
ncbi:MAG: hypothetical protein CL912_00945 [Deltaproteobacteria bacterium]|nr:hypothetical protein [Deltaproteobacteria bacterium]